MIVHYLRMSARTYQYTPTRIVVNYTNYNIILYGGTENYFTYR
jgi:hypothetical protein